MILSFIFCRLMLDTEHLWIHKLLSRKTFVAAVENCENSCKKSLTVCVCLYLVKCGSVWPCSISHSSERGMLEISDSKLIQMFQILNVFGRFRH